MEIKKKIAMTFGGAALAACITAGGLAAANAATPTGGQETAGATTSATVHVASKGAAVASTSPAASVAVPALPDRPYDWNVWIATLSPAQQRALLADQEAKLAKYKQEGFTPFVKKVSYNVSALKKALGQ